jgi:hypothetical protein
MQILCFYCAKDATIFNSEKNIHVCDFHASALFESKTKPESSLKNRLVHKISEAELDISKSKQELSDLQDKLANLEKLLQICKRTLDTL